jgi:hypothetical protein
MSLREVLMRKYDLEEAEEVLEIMVCEVQGGRDPEEVLYDEGLEPDYVMDLMDECYFVTI